MKIHQPIKGYINKYYPTGHVSQFFGENVAMYMKAIGTNGHNGIDIVAPWGTPIYAVEDGIVCDVKNSAEGYGKHCRILSNGNEWTYGHASENLVTIGQQVKAGDIIQKMGNTGFVVSGATPYWKYNPYAGTHLHLGLRKYKESPIYGWAYSNEAYIKGVPKIEVLNHNNGFMGSVDFRDMLETTQTEGGVVEDEEVIKGLQLTVISLMTQIINILKARKGVDK